MHDLNGEIYVFVGLTDRKKFHEHKKNIERLSIVMFHAGLHHTAQIVEPVGLPPLWITLQPDIRHSVIERVMRALNLIYRYDLSKDLQAVIVFRVDDPGSGNLYAEITPDSCNPVEGGLSLKGTDYISPQTLAGLNVYQRKSVNIGFNKLNT